MYEKMTFDAIMARMLERVPANIDAREGSVIYDALAPAAAELAQYYIELDNILKETFGDTASRSGLVRRAAERMLAPYEAKSAIVKGVCVPKSTDVPIGSRFNLGRLNYIVEAKLAEGEYQMLCEEPGREGGQVFGDMTPIEYIAGLQKMVLESVLVSGEDREDTERFRDRYMDTFSTLRYGGNKKDYVDRTDAVQGVGATKVTPVWQGGGTVKLTILDSDFNVPDAALVQRVQNEIDPQQDEKGDGIAPVGHVVTVVPGVGVEVILDATLVLDSSITEEMARAQVVLIMEEYLLECRKEWEKQSATIVRIAQIEAQIMQIKGVMDVSSTLNGSADNLVLGYEEVPLLKEVLLHVQ